MQAPACEVEFRSSEDSVKINKVDSSGGGWERSLWREDMWSLGSQPWASEKASEKLELSSDKDGFCRVELFILPIITDPALFLVLIPTSKACTKAGVCFPINKCWKFQHCLNATVLGNGVQGEVFGSWGLHT